MANNDINTLYQSYVTAPGPDTLRGVVDALEPSINYAVSSIGAAGDNLIKTKARLVAGNAIKKFDPAAGANLPTWVSNQLMQLRRFRRETQMPIKVPERTQLDAYTIMNKEKEFIDLNDREPDLDELADFAKMPAKRIEKVRRSFRKMPSEGAIEAAGGLSQYNTDYANESMSYVYRESDKLDKKIIEMKTGYGGKYDTMQPKDIAIKLGLTPSQLTRRSAKIFMKMQKYESALSGI